VGPNARIERDEHEIWRLLEREVGSMSERASDGTPRRAPDGPYRSEVHPAPEPEPQREVTQLARAAVGAGLSVWVVGPLVGLAILRVGDYKEEAWSRGLAIGPVLAAVAVVFCLSVAVISPAGESRKRALAGAGAAVVGAVATRYVTLILGFLFALVAHPLHGYH
jgi:hypothetical protein